MRRFTIAAALLSVISLSMTGCRQPPVQGGHIRHGGGGGGPLAPSPDPTFGSGGGGGITPPMLPPAASKSRPNLFKQVSQTRSTPGLLPTPEDAMPTAVSAPSLW